MDRIQRKSSSAFLLGAVLILLAFACEPHRASSDGGLICPPGQMFCDGNCTNTASDPQHCGGCELSCGSGRACLDAVCRGTEVAGDGGQGSDGGNSSDGGKAGPALWSKRFGGADSEEQVRLALDIAGNIYLAGECFGTSTAIDLGGGPIACGLPGVFIAKLTANGAHLWSRSFDAGNGWATLEGLTVDGAGNLLVTGRFEGTLTLGNLSLQSGASGGLYDLYVAKFSSEGSPVFAKQFAHPTDCGTKTCGRSSRTAGAIIANGQGHFAVTGCFLVPIPQTGEVYGVNLGGGAVIVSDWASTCFLAAFDAAGNYQRHVLSSGGRSFLFPSLLDDGRIVYIDEHGELRRLELNGSTQKVSSGGLFLASIADDSGRVWGFGRCPSGAATVEFGGGVSVPCSSTNDQFVVAFGADGSAAAAVHIAGPVGVSSMVRDVARGRLLLTGEFFLATDFGGGPIPAPRYPQHSFGAVLDSTSLTHVWSADLGSMIGKGLVANPAGDLVYAAIFAGQLDLGNGPLVCQGRTDIALATLRP